MSFIQYDKHKYDTSFYKKNLGNLYILITFKNINILHPTKFLTLHMKNDHEQMTVIILQYHPELVFHALHHLLTQVTVNFLNFLVLYWAWNNTLSKVKLKQLQSCIRYPNAPSGKKNSNAATFYLTSDGWFAIELWHHIWSENVADLSWPPDFNTISLSVCIQSIMIIQATNLCMQIWVYIM